MKKPVLIFLAVIFCNPLFSQLKIGVAKVKITPESPVWMAGYASRNKPSQGILQDIWTKAVAIGDGQNRVIIVTSDIIGFSHEASQNIIQRIISEHGLSRSQILLNSSHTHSGPVVWPGLSHMYNLQDSNLTGAIHYSRKLCDAVVEVAGMALGNMEPGSISTGTGTADFAMNRREVTDKGIVIGLNPSGPGDHSVPVVKFCDASGNMIAVLFGYACHNTTLNSYDICGDYAGFAQSELEDRYPGSMALFMSGCGADQNPNPRRTVDAAKDHGKALASSVERVLEGELRQVKPFVKTAFTVVTLEFPQFDNEKYWKETEDPNVFKRRRAVFFIEAYERGYILDKVNYPVQAIRFGKELTILGMAGEVVVDYSLTFKKRYPGENLFVAGYCNELPCYIPSARILKEGGYEAEENLLYFGMPGPFKPNVEDLITTAVSKVMKKAGAHD